MQATSSGGGDQMTQVAKWIAQPQARMLLASVALLSGFALAESLAAGDNATILLTIYALCLAAVIGSGKLASP